MLICIGSVAKELHSINFLECSIDGPNSPASCKNERKNMLESHKKLLKEEKPSIEHLLFLAKSIVWIYLIIIMIFLLTVNLL